METTLVIIKPDAVQRRLVGRILERFERKGLRLAGMKFTMISREVAEQLYSVHKGSHFFEPLVKFMTSGPVLALALHGMKAIQVCRAIAGATYAAEAQAGTVRGDLGLSNRFNLIHCAESPEAVAKELPLFFGQRDLLPYEMTDERWVYDLTGETPV